MDTNSTVAEFLKDYGFVQPEDYSYFKTNENEMSDYDADYYYSDYYNDDNEEDGDNILKTITKHAITPGKEVQDVVYNDNLLDRMDSFMFSVPKLNEKIILKNDHIINGVYYKKGTIIERTE